MLNVLSGNKIGNVFPRFISKCYQYQSHTDVESVFWIKSLSRTMHLGNGLNKNKC